MLSRKGQTLVELLISVIVAVTAAAAVFKNVVSVKTLGAKSDVAEVEVFAMRAASEILGQFVYVDPTDTVFRKNYFNASLANSGTGSYPPCTFTDGAGLSTPALTCASGDWALNGSTNGITHDITTWAKQTFPGFSTVNFIMSYTVTNLSSGCADNCTTTNYCCPKQVDFLLKCTVANDPLCNF